MIIITFLKTIENFKNTKIKLKRRKKLIYLTKQTLILKKSEDQLMKNMVLKLYSEGLSIRTPLDINFQKQAIKSLRKE